MVFICQGLSAPNPGISLPFNVVSSSDSAQNLVWSTLFVKNDKSEVSEDVAVKIPVLRNDYDNQVGLDSSSLALVSSSLSGLAAISIDHSTGLVKYQPPSDFFGLDSFQYTICNSRGECDTATVWITVHPVNDSPRARVDTVRVNEDESIQFDPAQNDFDMDIGDQPNLQVEIKTQPHFGHVELIDQFHIRYTPLDHYFGKDFFYYRICDAMGSCDSSMVQLLVSPMNDPPIINADFDTTFMDLLAVINPLVNDFDSLDKAQINRSSLKIPLLSAASGTLYLDSTVGMIIYLPPPGFVGRDSFNYHVCDEGPGESLCGEAVINITVLPQLPQSVRPAQLPQRNLQTKHRLSPNRSQGETTQRPRSSSHRMYQRRFDGEQRKKT